MRVANVVRQALAATGVAAALVVTVQAPALADSVRITNDSVRITTTDR
jgi:hypothetical protein